MMDDFVAETNHRGDAWRQAKQGAPIVTWVGQTPAHDAAGSSIRLHFHIVDHLIGLGVVAVGWLADPLSAAAAISVVLALDETLDLLDEAALLTDRHAINDFDGATGTPIKFGFVLVVPERLLDKVDGLRLRLQLSSGSFSNFIIPRVGDFSRLSEILTAAPLDFALRLTARLLNVWRSTEGGSYPLPERLEAFAIRIHQRIGLPGGGAQAGYPNPQCDIDAAIRVGTTGMLVSGWLVPAHADTMKEVALVSLSGRRVVLDTPLPKKSAPGGLVLDNGSPAPIDCGFAAFAAIEALDRRDQLWFFEVITASCAVRRVPFVCPPEPTPFKGIEAAVMLADVEASNLPELFERAISPAVESFWAQTRGPGLDPAEVVFGTPPSGPRVSVIVPVYGRLDFVRHQIARFSNDPEFGAEGRTVDLIYVLDDPSKEDDFSRLCRSLYEVYGVPFRTLVLGENLGYSAANNAGARIATGELLLLLNSDVFPIKSRWVGHLASTYDSLDHCGILGCRLLFEDGSIQHAGMRFRESRVVRGGWENDHPGKGLSPLFDSHTSVAPVQAVTGACLMIERALFNTLGGMSEEYVIGDFEDSDLCLRAQAQGFKVFYTPEVELYHLERQSMQGFGQENSGWRQSLTLYNEWQHGRRWKMLIPKILESVDPLPASLREHHPPGRSRVALEKPSKILPIKRERSALVGNRRDAEVRLARTVKRPGSADG